jgi:hypothetical protein
MASVLSFLFCLSLAKEAGLLLFAFFFRDFFTSCDTRFYKAHDTYLFSGSVFVNNINLLSIEILPIFFLLFRLMAG